MKVMLLVLALVVMLIPATQVMAEESSPYLVGEWFLGDTFKDGDTQVNIADTQFTFINPTKVRLALEYAFFDSNGEFCGCDRDFMDPNGRTRYTMSAEASGGQFICTTANNNLETEGTMKAIVFQAGRKGRISIKDSLQVGYQIHFFQNGPPTESALRAITVTPRTEDEIDSIHQKCVTFCNSHGDLCPPLP